MAHVFGLCFSLLSTFATASTGGAVNQVGCSSVDDIASVVLECNSRNLDVELKDGNTSLSFLAKHLPTSVRALRIAIPRGGVSVEGFKALGAALPEELQSLGLGLEGTNIGNARAKSFVTHLSNNVKKLQSLDLNLKHTKVTGAGILDVVSSLPELEALSLKVTVNVTEVTEASLDDVSRTLSGKVQSLFLEVLDDSGDATEDTFKTLMRLKKWLKGCKPKATWAEDSQTSYLRADCSLFTINSPPAPTTSPLYVYP
jgi:hypothetical protein